MTRRVSPLNGLRSLAPASNATSARAPGGWCRLPGSSESRRLTASFPAHRGECGMATRKRRPFARFTYEAPEALWRQEVRLVPASLGAQQDHAGHGQRRVGTLGLPRLRSEGGEGDMTAPACVHWYILPTPSGPTITGVCKYCGETREFLSGGAAWKIGR